MTSDKPQDVHRLVTQAGNDLALAIKVPPSFRGLAGRRASPNCNLIATFTSPGRFSIHVIDKELE